MKVILRVLVVFLGITDVRTNSFAQPGWSWQNPLPQGNGIGTRPLLRGTSVAQHPGPMPVAFSATILRRFAVVALLLPSLSHAYVLKRDSSGAAIRWTRPVEFVVDSQLNQILGEPQAIAAVRSALSSWSVAAPTLPMSLTAGQVEEMAYDQSNEARNRNEIYGLPQWVFDDNAIAVTLVTTDTVSHEILDADIAMNIQSHIFRVLPVPHTNNRFDDIQSVLTHELGHAFGLAHNPNDSSVVMYPSARLGEISKRLLSLDDEEGIAALYPPGGPRTRDASGCNALPRGSDAAGLALMVPAFWLLRRHRRRATLSRSQQPHRGRSTLLALLLLPASARAYQNERADAAVKNAAVVATAEVLSTRLHPDSKNSRVLITEVELSVRSCIKGNCPQRMVVMVVGGRSGKIEQFIEGEPVPEEGAILGVTLASGTSPDLPALGQARVYRLSVARDFAAFARGLQAAGLTAVLPLPRSVAPSRGDDSRPETWPGVY
jgi:hypothetical protein